MAQTEFESQASIGPITTLNDDAAWCWFQTPRALVVGDRVIFGSVAGGAHDAERAGHIEVNEWRPDTGDVRRAVLHANLQADDHNAPAILPRTDGRLLAVYTAHSKEGRIYWRISDDEHDATRWGPRQTLEFDADALACYSNLLPMIEGNADKRRLYNIARIHFKGQTGSNKPWWLVSDDEGETWSLGNKLIDIADDYRHRPYLRFASNGRDTFHVVFTEGHPREFGATGLYHAYCRDGVMHQTDGTPIRALTAGPTHPHEASLLYAGTPEARAWVWDVALTDDGRPVVAYSRRIESETTAHLERDDPRAGQDLRYGYAWWDGAQWQRREIAFAGQRLYNGEDDYAGGICLDPDQPHIVYFSSNVDPSSGKPTRTQRYQLYRMQLSNPDALPDIETLTIASDVDHLRPLMPARHGDTGATLLWMRGRYRRFTDYDTQIVGAPVG